MWVRCYNSLSYPILLVISKFIRALASCWHVLLKLPELGLNFHKEIPSYKFAFSHDRGVYFFNFRNFSKSTKQKIPNKYLLIVLNIFKFKKNKTNIFPLLSYYLTQLYIFATTKLSKWWFLIMRYCWIYVT